MIQPNLIAIKTSQSCPMKRKMCQFVLSSTPTTCTNHLSLALTLSLDSLLLLSCCYLLRDEKTNVMCSVLCVIFNRLFVLHRASVRSFQFVISSILSLLQIFNYDMCIFSNIRFRMRLVQFNNKIEWCKRFIFVNGDIHLEAAEHWRRCAAFCNPYYYSFPFFVCVDVEIAEDRERAREWKKMLIVLRESDGSRNEIMNGSM